MRVCYREGGGYVKYYSKFILGFIITRFLSDVLNGFHSLIDHLFYIETRILIHCTAIIVTVESTQKPIRNDCELLQVIQKNTKKPPNILHS